MLHSNTHYYLNNVRRFKKSLEVIFNSSFQNNIVAENEKWSYFSNLPTNGHRLKKKVLDMGLEFLLLLESKLFKNRILSLWFKYYLYVVTSCFHF